MRHIFAIGIKLVIVGTVVLSIFGVFSTASLSSLIMMSLIITLLSYGIGDLFILPQLGNVLATIVDFAIYFLAVWSLAGLFIGVETGLTLASLAITYFITLAEPLFHAYVTERVFEIEDEVIVPLEQYQTEISEEKVVSFDELKKSKDKSFKKDK